MMSRGRADLKARARRAEKSKMKARIVYAEPADYFPEDIRRKHRLGEFSEPDALTKIKAVMLGHAVADALGVPVEFLSREELDALPVTHMMGYGSYPVPEGSFSDDTSMSLSALDVLSQGRDDYGEIMRGFERWLTLGEYTPTGEAFDVGRTCLEAIRKFDGGAHPATECGSSLEYSNGNGSLMRIHPFALYLYFTGRADAEHIEVIHDASRMTHAHERSLIGCGIYTFILWELMRCPARESVIRGIKFARDYYRDYPELSHYERLIYEICGLDKAHGESKNAEYISRDKIKSTGYIVDTLEAVIWSLLTTNDYRSCVLRAVNLGEDTDTVGSIAGGLAGALYGYDAIPDEWLSALLKRDYIEALCHRAYLNWCA